MKSLTLYKEMERWMIKYKKNSVKLSSYITMMNNLKRLGKYRISEIPPGDLSMDDIQSFINDLVNDRYSRETIRKAYILLREYLDYAVYSGIITRPIHRAAKIPSEFTVLKKKRNVTAYSDEEQKALCAVLNGGEKQAYYVGILMFETGLRVGEAIALHWSDVDWRRKALTVSKTAVRSEQDKDGYIQDGAKTFSSNRTIPLSSTAQRALESMKSFASDSVFIFHDKDGKPLHYDYVKYWIREACQEAGVEYRGLHVFRHTFATNCYYRGCEVKLLSKMLGHSSVSTTYNMYIHLYGDALEDMRAILK